MPTRYESASEANKSSFTQEELNAAYEKGRKVGKWEGMLAYQKRIVDNLLKENKVLTDRLEEAKK